MFSRDFLQRRVEAFRAAGSKASLKNDVSGCEPDEGYLECCRQVRLPTSKAQAGLVARLVAVVDGLTWDPDTQKLSEGEAGEGGETCFTVRAGKASVKVLMIYRRYFGAECRDNTPEDFAAWAQSTSALFDEVETALASVG